MSLTVISEQEPLRRRRLQEFLTARLPDWFGLPEANRDYAKSAEAFPGWVARENDRDVGLLLLRQHAPISTEIYWLGVDPAFHRKGVGRALVTAAEANCATNGCKYLFVLTLHPSDADDFYRRTRAFYTGVGFDYVLDCQWHGSPPSRNRLAYYMKEIMP